MSILIYDLFETGIRGDSEVCQGYASMKNNNSCNNYIVCNKTLYNVTKIKLVTYIIIHQIENGKL